MNPEEAKPESGPVFKATSLISGAKPGGKKRAWKSLKQIVSSERSLPWPEDHVHYGSVNAPPSFLPAEKFSDLSGLPAPYTDPQTRLRYANKEEYATLVTLPMDITAGYLALRGASSIVGNEQHGKMDVFLMIRRKKLTIFTDAKDTTTVLELKKIIEGILKVQPNNQKLFNKDNTVMEDDKALQDYGLNANTAKAQSPATVGLAVRDPDGEFEQLELTPYSAPPDLPDVMKSQESVNGQEQSS